MAVAVAVVVVAVVVVAAAVAAAAVVVVVCVLPIDCWTKNLGKQKLHYLALLPDLVSRTSKAHSCCLQFLPFLTIRTIAVN